MQRTPPVTRSQSAAANLNNQLNNQDNEAQGNGAPPPQYNDDENNPLDQTIHRGRVQNRQPPGGQRRRNNSADNRRQFGDLFGNGRGGQNRQPGFGVFDRNNHQPAYDDLDVFANMQQNMADTMLQMQRNFAQSQQAMMQQMQQMQMNALQQMQQMQQNAQQQNQQLLERQQSMMLDAQNNSGPQPVSNIDRPASGSGEVKHLVRSLASEFLQDEDYENYSKMAVLSTFFEKGIIQFAASDSQIDSFMSNVADYGVPDAANAPLFKLFLAQWANDVKISKPFSSGVHEQKSNKRGGVTNKPSENATGTCTRWNFTSCRFSSENCKYLHSCMYCAERGAYNQIHKAVNCSYNKNLHASDARPRSNTTPAVADGGSEGQSENVNATLAALAQLVNRR